MGHSHKSIKYDSDRFIKFLRLASLLLKEMPKGIVTYGNQI
jgi:hypothetical protein